MSSHRAAAVAGQLALAAVILGAGAGSARAQQVVDHQQPLLTLFTHGVTLTHHVVWNHLCDTCTNYDSHRFVERQITVFRDGSLRSVDSFNELEDHAPAFASSPSGKGTQATFDELLQAVRSANLPEQTGNCSVPGSIQGIDSIYILTIEINHDAYLTWLAAGDDQRVELSLNHQGPVCPPELAALLAAIMKYEQEVITYNPHVSANP